MEAKQFSRLMDSVRQAGKRKKEIQEQGELSDVIIPLPKEVTKVGVFIKGKRYDTAQDLLNDKDVKIPTKIWSVLKKIAKGTASITVMKNGKIIVD